MWSTNDEIRFLSDLASRGRLDLVKEYVRILPVRRFDPGVNAAQVLAKAEEVLRKGEPARDEGQECAGKRRDGGEGKSMAVLKRKTKVISIRMYEEDFTNLEAACRRQESASLSDLVRAALVDFVANREREAPLGLEGIQSQLVSLEKKVDSLQGLFAARAAAG